MNNVLIGQNGPRNQVWLLAALTLPYTERVEAMMDIAELLGASFAQVISAVSRVKAAGHAAATESAYGARRQPSTAAPFHPAHKAPALRLTPSTLRQPTQAQLMGAR